MISDSLFADWQALVVNAEGRVLTSDQMRAGLYILPSEAALASSLLQGGSFNPPAPLQRLADDESPGTVLIVIPWQSTLACQL